jgi:hypothetical protein
MLRHVLVVCAVGIAALFVSASAGAVTIHQHTMIERPLGPPIEVVRVVTVAPPDTDDDGCADEKDNYDGPGCVKPPPPPPAPVAPATTSYPTTAPAPTTTSGGCPSYMAGEASSPDAVNASSGASGCYQVLPSTAAAMGSACSDVNATSCVAAICASSGNAAWAASGSTPCDYIKP